MTDQAAGLRRLAGQLLAEGGGKEAVSRPDPGDGAPACRVMAIASGKGGVGKSNLAVNLALALVQRAQRVLLVDADLGLGNVEMLLGEARRRTMGSALRGECALAEAVGRGPGGLRYLPGGSGFEDLASLPADRLAELIAELKGLCGGEDFLLFDTGAGLHPTVLAFLRAAPEAIVVTTPEPTAVADAYAVLKALARHNPEARCYVVANQVADQAEGEATLRAIVRVAERYLPRAPIALGAIPRDAALWQAVRDQSPVLLASPLAPSSRSYRRLAQVLLGLGEARDGGTGFFERFLHRLRSGHSA